MSGKSLWISSGLALVLFAQSGSVRPVCADARIATQAGAAAAAATAHASVAGGIYLTQVAYELVKRRDRRRNSGPAGAAGATARAWA
jgi:predicted alternative tryptophan synthase beta-subunit